MSNNSYQHFIGSGGEGIVTQSCKSPASDKIYLYELLLEKTKLEETLSRNPIHAVTLEHTHRLLTAEIERLQAALSITDSRASFTLPQPRGPIVIIVDKLYIPVDKFPGYNFIGRILGPRGMTVKQLEQETGCKITVKGREAVTKSLPQASGITKSVTKVEVVIDEAEHAPTDDKQCTTTTTTTEKSSKQQASLEACKKKGGDKQVIDARPYVIISVEDTENRAYLKLQRGVAEISKLLHPKMVGDDQKRKQLMELAIINGTYRPLANPYDGRPPSYAPQTASRSILQPVLNRFRAVQEMAMTNIDEHHNGSFTNHGFHQMQAVGMPCTNGDWFMKIGLINMQ